MKIGAVILRGGRSSRMGSDKAGLRLGGRTFLELIKGELSDFDELLISVAEGEGDAGTVSDIYKKCGPMGVIYSALRAAKSDALLVVPCDLPLFGRSLARELAANMDEDTDALICVTDDKIHPICGIYSKSCLETMKYCLESGQLRMRLLLERLRTRQLYVSDMAYMLKNINTPEDFKALYTGDMGCKLLPSKRNLVLLMTGRRPPYIIKRFAEKAPLERELSVLNRLSAAGLPVSAARRTDENTLELEYLPGITALEYFEKREAEGAFFGEKDKDVCNLLVNWLSDFYSAAGEGICLNDMNLRNFIYQPEKGRFVGVDFECCGEGIRSRDAGALLAYILSYHPGFTSYKLAMAEYLRSLLADMLGILEEEIKKECSAELESIRLRRGAGNRRGGCG
jgi:molybdopterin-guanine dinucleotide biosynthesis protein A